MPMPLRPFTRRLRAPSPSRQDPWSEGPEGHSPATSGLKAPHVKVPHVKAFIRHQWAQSPSRQLKVLHVKIPHVTGP